MAVISFSSLRTPTLLPHYFHTSVGRRGPEGGGGAPDLLLRLLVPLLVLRVCRGQAPAQWHSRISRRGDPLQAEDTHGGVEVVWAGVGRREMAAHLISRCASSS